jgi:hypothetical protein
MIFPGTFVPSFYSLRPTWWAVDLWQSGTS